LDQFARREKPFPRDIRRSAPQQSANVSSVAVVPLPQTIASPTSDTNTANLGVFAPASDAPAVGAVALTATAVAAAQKQLERRSAITMDPIAKPALDAAMQAAGLHIAPGPPGSVISINPGAIATLRHELQELAAAGGGPQLVVRSPGAANALHRRRGGRPAADRR
jgi:hypothetical protein